MITAGITRQAAAQKDYRDHKANDDATKIAAFVLDENHIPMRKPNKPPSVLCDFASPGPVQNANLGNPLGIVVSRLHGLCTQQQESDATCQPSLYRLLLER